MAEGEGVSERRGSLALAGVLVLGLIAIGVAITIANVSAERTELRPVTLEQRALLPELPRELVNEGWGSFRIEDGAVRIDERGENGNTYLTDVGVTDGRISLIADVPAPSWRFVFRAQDEDNYWAVASYPGFNGWQLEKRTDGVPERVGEFIEFPTDRPTRINLDLGGRFIQMTIGEPVVGSDEPSETAQTIVMADAYLSDQTKVGFSVDPAAFPRIGWRDVRIWDIDRQSAFR